MCFCTHNPMFYLFIIKVNILFFIMRLTLLYIKFLHVSFLLLSTYSLFVLISNPLYDNYYFLPDAPVFNV